ncbi:MAG: preprotein translocase subunit YajC [Chloroflexi bacterium]|nr:preprotein translocase subunit YajC [Chloroflexota bacterium]
MEIMFSLLLVLGMFYVVLILPLQSQKRRVRRLQAELKVGDEVVTAAGLIGQIREVAGEEVSLALTEGVVVRVVRSAILERRPAATAMQTTNEEPPASGGLGG